MQNGDFYQEKVVYGFNILANAYLLMYPQLGFNLGFEKYFGEQIALISLDKKVKNAQSVIVDANYTFIP